MGKKPHTAERLSAEAVEDLLAILAEALILAGGRKGVRRRKRTIRALLGAKTSKPDVRAESRAFMRAALKISQKIKSRLNG